MTVKTSLRRFNAHTVCGCLLGGAPLTEQNYLIAPYLSTMACTSFRGSKNGKNFPQKALLSWVAFPIRM